MELALMGTDPLAPFQRGSLMMARRPGPDGMLAWLAGDARGCIVFTIMPTSVPIFHGVLIKGQHWMGVDIGRHTPQPMADYDHDPRPCEYLDGVPCYYDGSSLQAGNLLQRAVLADSEDVIWTALAEYHAAWIGSRAVTTKERGEA